MNGSRLAYWQNLENVTGSEICIWNITHEERKPDKSDTDIVDLDLVSDPKTHLKKKEDNDDDDKDSEITSLQPQMDTSLMHITSIWSRTNLDLQ